MSVVPQLHVLFTKEVTLRGVLLAVSFLSDEPQLPLPVEFGLAHGANYREFAIIADGDVAAANLDQTRVRLEPGGTRQWRLGTMDGESIIAEVRRPMDENAPCTEPIDINVEAYTMAGDLDEEGEEAIVLMLSFPYEGPASSSSKRRRKLMRARRRWKLFRA